MAVRSRSGGDLGVRSQVRSEPVKSTEVATFGEYVGEDEIVMLLLPRSTWDAAAELGRQLGDISNGPPIAVPLVLGEALKRLQAEVDRLRRR